MGNTAWSFPMLFRRFIGHFANSSSKIPLHDHYVQLFVREGMSQEQAETLITAMDNQVKQK